VDALEAILTRRSIRRFLNKPVDRDLLSQIVEAASCAPAAENRRPWKFIVVQDASLVRLVKRLSPGISFVPACIMAICSESRTQQNRFDSYLATASCAMAGQNMLLAAHALGLGACLVRSFSSAAVREILGVPSGLEIELLVALGYSDEVPAPRSRSASEEIIFRDRYGNPW